MYDSKSRAAPHNDTAEDESGRQSRPTKPADLAKAGPGRAAGPSKPKTLARLLRDRAGVDGDRDAFVFLQYASSDTPQVAGLTYGELFDRAKAIAATLQGRLASGDRVLILCPPGIDYIVGFFGCQLAGLVAVPAYPPRNARHWGRLRAIVEDAGATAILAPTDLVDRLTGWAGGADQLPAMMAIDHIDRGLRDRWRDPNLDADDLAFLQYTSGTTGRPKGVMVTHANALANLRVMSASWPLTNKDVSALWLPPYHDMGLVGGLLMPVFVGFQSVMMSPVAFSQRPKRWLEAIGHWQATVTTAPNFAYQLCADQIDQDSVVDLDLRSLRIAFTGSETVRAATIEAFAAKFGAAGFQKDRFVPVYGMAETVLLTTTPRPGRAPLARIFDEPSDEAGSFGQVDAGANGGSGRRDMPNAPSVGISERRVVSCGSAIAGHDMKIVDPKTRRERPAGAVGEVWITGPSVAAGYWDQADATADTFRAGLADDPENRPWLRTGDLGALVDGELFVTGRIKEMIIVRGRNLYAHDVEAAAVQDPLLGADRTVAFGVHVKADGGFAPLDDTPETTGGEQVVLVHETSRSSLRALDAPSLASAMRRGVMETQGVDVAAIAFVKPASLPRTTSGKLQRRHVRDLFLSDGLAEVARWQPGKTATDEKHSGLSVPADRNAASLELWLRDHIAAAIGIPARDVPVDVALADIGLDSLEAVRLSSRLADALSIEFDAVELFSFPTIIALAERLADPKLPAISRSQRPSAADDPIAIVGMACRFPGSGDDVGDFWTLLRQGRDASRTIPGDRATLPGWSSEHSPGLHPDATHRGGYIDDIDRFDASFFEIAPVEAAAMDPQQRLLLETSWRALEDAAIDPASLRGSRTGVYVGISNSDYQVILRTLQRSRDGRDLSVHAATGAANSVAAGRLSYVLGLNGPAASIDTACSSSLVAVDQACEALCHGRSDLVLVAGVNAVLTDDLTQTFAAAGMLSRDGRCKTFDASADGYVRGEGCGVVVLKRLSDAECDDDRILAIIRGSAVNQDGASNGLTAPNGPAQERVIGAALARAGLRPADIDYLECHGTGTELGDPIEVRAAASAYGPGRDPGWPLLLGSVKTNIGHLEAAAGMAGLIKTVLALEHGLIPKHLNFETPNPHIDWDALPVLVTAEATPLRPPGDRPARAGVSSFGFSGTNAHVIVEGYRPTEKRPSLPVTLPLGLEAPVLDDLRPRSHHLLPLSTKSAGALPDLARGYLGWLEANETADLADLTYTAGVGRSHFAERAGLVFADRTELTAKLEALATGEAAAGLVTGTSSGAPRVAFLFTGQGSQWLGMGRDLYETEPVFRSVLDRCDQVIRELRGVSLLDVMMGRESATGDLPGDLDHTAWTQPALYALGAGLVALYRSVGVEPSMVLGHSVGELCAAHAAGVFGLAEGLRLAAARGALMGALPAESERAGSMAAVFAHAGRVAAAVAAVNETAEGVGLSLAADNGSHQVVSGPSDLVEDLVARVECEGVRCQGLATSHAFHSGLMEPVLDDLEAAAGALVPSAPTVPLISNVTGQVVGAEERLDGAYWRRHARGAVRFADGVAALSALDVDVVLELGPQSVLGPLAALAWPGDAERPVPTFIASLARGGEAGASYASALAGLYAAGAALEFGALHGGEVRRKLALPGTPFQRERYWIDPPKRRRPADGHPLLGQRHELPKGEVSFESEVLASDPEWLSDYRVFDRVVAPGALYASLAATATMEVKRRALNGSAAAAVGPVVLEGMQLHAPLMLGEASDDPGRSLQVMLGCPEAGEAPDGETRVKEARSVEIYSRGSGEEGWRLHAEGRVSAGAVEMAAAVDPAALTDGLTAVDVAGLYGSLAALGLGYGASFQGLASVWSGSGEAVGEVVLAAGLETPDLLAHPAQLDGCFQVLAAALGERAGETGGEADGEGAVTYLPFGWQRLWLSGALPERVLCHARLRPAAEGGGDSADGAVPEVRLADLALYDAEGRPLGGVTGLSLKRATRAALLSATEQVEELLYEVVWRERPLAGGPPPAAFLAAPARLAEAAPGVAALLAEEGLDPADLSRFLDDSERLSRAYALAALEGLGWDRRAGSVVVASDLRRRLKVVEGHERLFGRLLGLLAEAGVLAADEAEAADGRYRVLVGAGDRLPDRALGDPAALAASLEERYPFGRIELGLLSRCGAGLAEVLRGRSDPLALLFSEAGPSAAALYRDAPAAQAYNRLVAETVSAAVSALPEGRRLRVLEVGAGTGGTTASVLPVLPAGRVDYVYTDISAGFFADAEARFGSGLAYRVLDIERDPVAQGFAAHGYDLVLAANVLHATRDIGATLGHCRSLLAPSGLLVALEGLRRQGWLDLTFGLLEGWWRFADGYRPEHALLDGAGWRQVLSETGYEAASVLGANEAGASQGVIVARGPSDVRERPGLWLLAADGGGAAAALAEALATGLAGRDQTVVLAGAGLDDGAPDITEADIPEAEIPGPAAGRVTRAYVDGSRREAWVSLLDGLPGAVPLRGVVHLAALDGPDGEATLSELAAATARSGSSALALSQALQDRGAAPEGGLWLVTRGAQVVGREPAGGLSGTPLWGLGKTLALEAADLQPRMIDLDPAPEVQRDGQGGAQRPIQPLIEELLYPDGESHVAHRAEGRLAARLVRGITPSEPRSDAAATIRGDRSYLVTGGLGGIGLRVAGWLADRGAGRIVLNGRRPPGEAAEAAIGALRARGVSVDVRLADVTDADAVDGMLAEIAASPLPLGGVVHSVGVLSDAAVSNQSWERFETVLAPKLQGAWQLHRATLDLDLDLFVLFSSTAGVLGNAGQANHAAANAFLDQLARHRRSLGLAGQAMAWGAWSGMGEAEEQRERIAAGLAASGVGWIEPERGLRAFDCLVRQDVAAGVVVPLDWSVFGSRLKGWPGLLAELLAEQAVPSAVPAAENGAALRRRLASLPAAERPGLLAELVADELQSALCLRSAPELGVGFFDLGLDSLMAIELTRRLERALEVRLESSALFDYPTVETLARHLADELNAVPAGGLTGVQEVVHADRTQPIPATVQQKALWLLDQLDPAAGVAYNVWVAHRITGGLDRAALQKAAESLVRRHESLRTRLVRGATGPLQVIDDAETVDIFQSEDWSADSEQPDVAAYVDQLCRQRIALDADAPVRIHLITLDTKQHVLIIKGHHTVLDGASLGVLHEELAELYSAYRTGSDPDLAPLPIQYADYALWQSDRMSDDAFRNGLDYWRQTLAGAPSVTRLPTDRPRPVAMDYQSDAVAFEVPPDQLAALKALARSRGATLFMVLEAGLAALISRLSGVDDLVLGTAVSGRSRAEFEPQIGYFVNAVPLRHRIDPLEPFEVFLDAAKATVIAAFRHDDVPFASIVEAVSPVRSPNHSPLFQVMLVLQAPDDAGERTDLRLPGTVAEIVGANPGGHFDVSLDLIERPEGLVGRLSYATQLFDRETAARLASMYGRLLAAVASAPETAVADLPLLDGVERRQVVSGFNDTAAAYPRDKTVVELFAEQAATAPDTIAVVDGDRELSYGDLDAASSRLARHLIGLGVGPEVVVGVCLERSAELIIALLGIWKAGGAYLPLDPDYPEERLGFMLADAAVPVVLTAGALAGGLPEAPDGGTGRRLVALDDPETQAVLAGLTGTPITDAERRAPLTPACLAYVIYTSGSTGKPKGVMVGHGSLMNRLAWIQADHPIGPGDTILQKTPATFDVSVWEFFWWAVTGARVVMLAPGAHRDPAAVADVIVRHEVTVVHFVPSLFETYLTYLEAHPGSLAASRLSVVYTSGEALGAGAGSRFHAMARRAGRATALVNLYGPTEATVDVTAYRTDGDEADVPIGSPMANTQVYVVDERLEPQPVGVAGELLIGGVQVSRGYLGRAGLTAEKFIADPFSDAPGARLYRTGDLARWRPDGSLEFLGRIDHQVKIRGMRVELGEIEAALAACEGISQSAVIVDRLDTGSGAKNDIGAQLVAYVVPNRIRPEALISGVAAALGLNFEVPATLDETAIENALEGDDLDALADALQLPSPLPLELTIGEIVAAANRTSVIPLDGALDIEAIRTSLKRSLPEYMVPTGFVGLSRLPLTPSGKVDRKALPSVPISRAHAAYVEPQDAWEQLVADAFSELLDLPRVGRTDEFFQLGGNSLLAVRLAALLQQSTRNRIDLPIVFENPAVADLASALRTLQEDQDLADVVNELQPATAASKAIQAQVNNAQIQKP